MYRRRRRTDRNLDRRRPLFPFLRTPRGQLLTVLVVIATVIFIGLMGRQVGTVAEVSVDDALLKYQNGAFVLDVSWPAEWDEYHIPGSTLIPLDQLYNRYAELPKDREILIVSRSQTGSQQARDFLKSAGFNAVSMAGSMADWYERGYAIDGAPPQ
jgi:rhodanese-related sulfurtransferase